MLPEATHNELVVACRAILDLDQHVLEHVLLIDLNKFVMTPVTTDAIRGKYSGFTYDNIVDLLEYVITCCFRRVYANSDKLLIGFRH